MGEPDGWWAAQDDTATFEPTHGSWPEPGTTSTAVPGAGHSYPGAAGSETRARWSADADLMAPDAPQEGWALGAQQPPASAWPDAAEPARRGWSVEVDPQVYQPGPASPDEAFLAAQPRGWPGSDPALRGTDSEAGLPEQGVTGRPAGEDWARPGPAGRPGGWPAPDAQGGSGEWPADRPA
ncbi:hypothetical protein TR74_01485, partial [Carbonactinospora thermoautotrophica]